MQTVRLLVPWLIGSGILAILLGVLLDGPSGDPVGIYCAFSGLVLLAIGIGMFVAWMIISERRRVR